MLLVDGQAEDKAQLIAENAPTTTTHKLFTVHSPPPNTGLFSLQGLITLLIKLFKVYFYHEAASNNNGCVIFLNHIFGIPALRVK